MKAYSTIVRNMAQRFGVAGATPRGVPFLGYPFGLLRRFPVPILRVDPGLITPDQPTTFTASSLTPGTFYQIIINYLGAASVIVSQIDLQADVAGAISHPLTATDVLGKATWDTGTYLILLLQKPGIVVGITAFLVTTGI